MPDPQCSAVLDPVMRKILHGSCSGVMALPLVMAFAGILIILGLTGSFQVSSSRRALENVHARRLMDIVAQSALEEASSQAEENLPVVPYPPAKASRDTQLSDLVQIDSVDLKSTRTCYESEGFRFEPVSLAWSNFMREDIGAKSGGRLNRELGVVQMEVRFSFKTKYTVLRRKVTARRYATWEPSRTENGVRLHIYPNNVMLAVSEA